MELTKADLEMVLEVFQKLELIAAIDNVFSVEITISGEGGDHITIGYGEAGEPAILDVTTELQQSAITLAPQEGQWINVPPYPYTINCCQPVTDNVVPLPLINNWYWDAVSEEWKQKD